MSTLSRIHRRWLPVAVLTVVLLMAVVLFVARPSLAKPVASGSISGRVVAEAGGAPLTGATVRASDTSHQLNWYDNVESDGTYEIQGMATGSYIVDVVADGYGGVYYDDSCDDSGVDQVSVTDGQATTEINFSLGPQGTANGIVTDGGGRPIADATVEVFPGAGGIIRTATTGTDGRYTVGQLSTCEYVARVKAEGYSDQYYNGEPSWNDATRFQVNEGAQTSAIDFKLELGAIISGRVLDEAGQPIGDAWIQVAERMTGVQASGLSDPLTGAFSFTVPPGEYLLKATKDGYAVNYWNGVVWFQVPAGEQVEGIELILPPAAYVRPRVFMADGTTPLPGMRMRAGILAPNSYEFWSRDGSTGVSDANGLFDEDIAIPANRDVFMRTSITNQTLDFINEYYAAAGSTPAITRADPLILDPGETAEITFSIDPVPAAPVTPAGGGQVMLESSVTTTITIPPNAVTEEGVIMLHPAPAYSIAPFGVLPDGFFASVTAGTGGTIAEFLEPVTIEVAYSDADVPWGVEETELTLYFYDTDPLVNGWVALPSTVDASANILTGTTDHFANFQVMGSREGIYLPVTLMPRPEQTIDLGDVIRTIDSPGQYTQGLAYDGTALWIISENRLYRVNAQSGAVLTSFAGPAGDLQDLTWDGTALWVTSYQTGTLYRLSPSDGHVLHSIPSPSTKPVGLAWDGTSLWHTADNGRLYRLDPASGAILQDVANPLVNSTTMLAWDGSQLWLSAYSGSQLSRYRITDWQRTLSVPSRASGSKGIVWSEGNLWNAGFNDDTIYLIYVTAK